MKLKIQVPNTNPLLRPLLSTVKKKYGAGLKFSNLMNIGKKKHSSLENPEKCVDTSGGRGSAALFPPDYKTPALFVTRVAQASADGHFNVEPPTHSTLMS